MKGRAKERCTIWVVVCILSVSILFYLRRPSLPPKARPAVVHNLVEELSLEGNAKEDLKPPSKFRPGKDVMFFIHIPKSAGFTFRMILQQIVDHEFQSHGITQPPPSREKVHSCIIYCACPEGLVNLEGMAHILNADLVKGCSVVAGHFDYSNKIRLQENGIEGEILPITMLRHPVKRIISEYNFIVARMRRHPIALANFTLEEYVSSYLKAKKLDNLMVRMMAGVTEGHTLFNLTVANHIRTHPRLMLEMAKRHLKGATFFGLIEEWEKSLELLKYSFGWSKGAGLDSVESFHVMPPSPPPSDKIIRMIEDSEYLDILFYEFGKSLFEKRLSQMT